MNRDGVFYTIVFTFIVTFVFVLPLTLADQGTTELVAKNVENARRRAILSAMDIPFSGDEEAASLFQDVSARDLDGTVLYTYDKGDKTVAAKEFYGMGLWGTINGILAVDGEVSSTVGLQIIGHNETPGLGGRIDDDSFKDQFKGEELKDGRLKILSGAEVGSGGPADPKDGVVDGITGATRTSQAMEIIVNREIGEIKTLLGVNP